MTGAGHNAGYGGADGPPLERAVGRVSLRVEAVDGRDRVAGLGQAGCGRLLFPAVGRGRPVEAVLVNTSGGLTGGDRFDTVAEVGEGARAILTTQACERLYRSAGGQAEVSTRLVLGRGARLDWLPQETILFGGARLNRRLDAELGAGATLVLAEAVLLGRLASGERLAHGALRDRWRIRREGRLVFAEEAGFAGELAGALAAPATLAGHAAYATVLLAGGEPEAAAAALRALPEAAACEMGISAMDGLCLARLVAQDGAALRRGLLPVLGVLAGTVPLVWSL